MRPSKIQETISGRLTSHDRTRGQYKILGYLSAAAKHGLNQMIGLRDAVLGRPWMPDIPATIQPHHRHHTALIRGDPTRFG